MKKLLLSCCLIVGLATQAEDTLSSCDGAFEMPPQLSEACVNRLDEHFLSQPVWKQATVPFIELGAETRHWSPLNVRTMHLDYSDLDLSDDPPIWSDVLDGEIVKRNQVVVDSFKDTACMSLAQDGPIQPDLDLRCNGHDLVKYSIYIDACITAFSRIHAFNEQGLEDMNDRLFEPYLHSAWVSDKCGQMPITPIGDPEAMDDSPMTLTEIIELFRANHDTALRIAAKTGNPWARLMYMPVDLPVDSAYMQSLHEHDELLAHRLLASDLTFDALTVEDRIHHAVKAHELEGIDVGLFEYLEQFRFYASDIKNLEESLVDGTAVELKYPW